MQAAVLALRTSLFALREAENAHQGGSFSFAQLCTELR